MTFLKSSFIVLLMLSVSACFEDIKTLTAPKSLWNSEISGIPLGERQIITIEASKENLAQNHNLYEQECAKLQCHLLYSYLIKNEKAYFKALIAAPQIEELIKNTQTKVIDQSIIKGTVSSAADLQKRLEIKETAFHNLMNNFKQNLVNPIMIASELENLQSEIELLKFLLKIKEKSLTSNNDQPNEKPNLVLLDVTLETVKPVAGFNLSLIEYAFAQSYQILTYSSSQAIIFMALILPWLPIAVIAMWLLSIVFKHKIKIKSINQSSKNQDFELDHTLAVHEPKKGGLSGLFAKKDEDLKEPPEE